MKNKSICFSINTINQAEFILKEFNKKTQIIFYIKNYLIKGFGIDWLINFRYLLKKKSKSINFKIYVDAGFDSGLCIKLVQNNFNYIKIKSNVLIINKLKQIAKKNKVLLNPRFRVVDIKKFKITNIK